MPIIDVRTELSELFLGGSELARAGRCACWGLRVTPWLTSASLTPPGPSGRADPPPSRTPCVATGLKICYTVFTPSVKEGSQ